MYKSNSGVQWDKKKYKILGVSRKVPKSYKLQITEKIKNVKTTHYKWFPRADLQLLPEHDDAWSANFLRKRLQTGEMPKDKPVPKPKKPKAKESKAQIKIKKIKQVEQNKKQTKQLLKKKILKKTSGKAETMSDFLSQKIPNRIGFTKKQSGLVPCTKILFVFKTMD